MRYKTEKNPLSIYIGDGVESQDCLYCCDEMLNIVVSLQGNTKVQVGEKERTLKEGELQIINKFNPFIVFRSEINVFLVFKIDPAYFNKFYPGFSDMVYKTNGISGDWQLLELIAEIVMLLQSENQEYRLQLESSILQIGLELHRNYAGDKIKHQKDSKNYNERIAVYIGKHYCEPIMLSDLAKYVHLNEQYLSRHFSNLMGITISDYINIQRLYHSLDLLKNTDENILDIALQCGFVNVKSYYKVCKKYLGVTPSQYRNGLGEKKNCLTKEQHSILRHRALENLLVCINNKDRRIPEKQVYKINVQKKAGRLNKSWSRVLAFGKASDGLKAEMRKQLRMVQEEIPFQYVRFHGIFSDDI